jgi:inositol oxygenase
MVHAPEVTDYVKQAAAKLDVVSDHVDDVNVLKLKQQGGYDDESKFDAEKDKDNFRRYEEACDRVKNFYAVSEHLRVTVTGRGAPVRPTPPAVSCRTDPPR